MLHEAALLASPSAAGACFCSPQAQTPTRTLPCFCACTQQQGVVARNAFNDFLREEVATVEAARKLLDDRGVAHYWDTAAAFDFDSPPVPSAVWDRQ